ncbi:MAG: alpha-N-arabinofuranosidase, partial [Bacteroidaceae bacterium]|nr:alpha-N-arabinofuranosidase [Bacteroidaceae bacterium]
IHISLANASLNEAQEIELKLDGADMKNVSGTILTSKKIDDYNSFEKPDMVKTESYSGAKIKNGILRAKLPAKSIVTLTVNR